jgi:hypothetical protein
MSEEALSEREQNILHLIQRQAHIQCITDVLLDIDTPECLGKMETIFCVAYAIQDSLTPEQQKKIEDRLEIGLRPGGEFY